MIQQKHIPVKNDGQTLRTVERGLGKELTKVCSQWNFNPRELMEQAMDKSWMRKIEHDGHKLKSAVHECEESCVSFSSYSSLSVPLRWSGLLIDRAYTLRQKLAISLKKAQDATAASSKKKKKAQY